MNKNQTRSKYLRAHITLPKLTGVDYFKTSKHRLAYEDLLSTIWGDLINRLEAPIEVTETKTSRRVEVLGILRYFINHRTQKVTCRTKLGLFTEDGWRFSFRPTDRVMVDPPLICNKNLIGHVVSLWSKQIDHLANSYFAESQVDLNIEIMDCVNVINNQITSALFTAIRASACWKKLRGDVFQALALSPEIVNYARLSRKTLKKLNLSELHFNHVAENLDAFRKLYNDAPNLLWLYSCALKERILLKVSNNPVVDLKQILLNSGCTQRAWRIVAKANQRDFDQVINSDFSSWHHLVGYLQLHERLDRSKVISRKLACLFDHPNWNLHNANKLINYRGAAFQPNVFNKFIDESLRVNKSADLLAIETTSVLTWLATTKVKFDANQQRKPWAWFARKASEWFAEQLAFDQLNSLTWECGLSESELSGYRFTALTNAWLVRAEAVEKHHCVDQYIDSCLAGTYRVFRVQHITSKTSYTLGLRLHDEWAVDQVRGFANRHATESLRELCAVVAEGLNILYMEELKIRREQTIARHKNSKYRTYM